ncbi:FAD-dependent monooxygenase [Saccharothrix sp. S26]|uniref:FAD-dependent oxidoreductase n=1 Tax=Saccharothrix sp. S26 TaxID=2907215 RepID=UPI001F274F7A|nr:FAD-dependent oxidoreductase [Saccharothrix sp. S26]MCE6997197.1 FAD-dependent monooxygenase [Saccharothrix sp. S26]
MTKTTTPVLVVGGGLTGLSASIFLAWRGIPVVLAERHTGTSTDPKARVVNPRTMELYRAVGLEPAIRATRSPIEGHTVVAHAPTVAAPEALRLPTALNEDVGALSPCDWATIDQNQLEPLLRDRAVDLGVDVRFGTEVRDLRDAGDHVTALLCDRVGGRPHEVTARHVIAADGAHSPVRAMLGIPHDGPGALTRLLTVYFQADLSRPLAGRKVIAMILHNPTVRGTLTPLDQRGHWRFSISIGHDEDPAGYTEQRCGELLRAALGVDVPVRLDRVSRTPWEVSAQVARTVRVGRVFVAGDAAHVMPPIGAFGASTGVQDAFNLAWKLALVHLGTAGESLLDTYEVERLPVARRTTREALRRYEFGQGRRRGEVGGAPTAQRNTIFGYAYRDGAFIPEPDTASDGVDTDECLVEDPDHPSGRPGSRAPHLVLRRRDAQLSVLDLFGEGFVLLTGPTAVGWGAAAATVADRTGLGLTCHRIGDELRDIDGVFSSRYGIGPDGVVLVRPDGFVAWRAPLGHPAPDTVLADVVDRVLCRAAEGSRVPIGAAEVSGT